MAGRSATLAVKIITDASGASKGLDQASAKVGGFQSKLTKNASPAGKSVGSSLVKGFDTVLGTGLKMVGGAGAVVLGTALTKGFGRLTALDDAKAKLAGLGHSAGEVEKIMQNATTAVKGTAFGLGDAAGVAASVVAAGVKPGKDLTGVLTTVADTATIAGSSMQDMGSIFGKVAASNKLSGDAIQQLTDRGVPVLQILAKHYKVTAAEASKMVSKGKVDFKNFAAAMKEGVGGAAQKSGQTFKGAWANVLASLGRIGANLLAPLFGESKSVLQQLPAMLSGVEDKATSVGEAIAKVADWTKKNIALLKVLGTVAASVFAGMLVIRTVIAAWKAYQAVMAVVKAAQLGFAAASYGTAAATSYMTAATNAQRVALLLGAAAQKVVAGAAKVATAAQWAWNAAMNANPIGLIIAGVIAFIAVIALLWTKCKGFRTFVLAMWKAISSGAKAAWSGTKSAASAVLSWLRSAASTTGKAVRAVWSGINSAGRASWNAIKAVVRGVVAALRAYITAYKAVVLAVWSAIRASASAAWRGVRAVVSGVVAGIRAYLTALRAAASAVWSAIRTAGSSAWRALRSVAASALAGIRAPLSAVRSEASSVWASIRSAGSAAFASLRSIASGALNAILAPFRAIQSAISSVIGAVQSLIGWLSKIHVPHIKIPGLGKLFSAPAPAGPAYTASPTLRGVMAGNPVPSSGGPSLVINISGTLNDTDSARAVRRVLRNDERRRGGVLIGNDYSRRRSTS